VRLPVCGLYPPRIFSPIIVYLPRLLLLGNYLVFGMKNKLANAFFA
jgi:hypothetical protein